MLHSIAFETLMRASRNLNSLHRYQLNSIFRQNPKIRIKVENDRYAIQTVVNSKMLLALLKLRNKVDGFCNDLRFSIPSFTFIDPYDAASEHILIEDLASGQIIGGFRLLSSSYTKKFTTEEIFSLNELKSSSFNVLEISKFFILPEHKHRDLMSLTAQFLSEYLLNSNDDLVISAQKLNSRNSKDAALVFRYFSSMNLINDFYRISVQKHIQEPNFIHWKEHFKGDLSENEINESLSLLSPTFQETLDIGASICAGPAIDPLTNRIDFLTILHKDDLNRTLWKKSSFISESFVGSSIL